MDETPNTTPLPDATTAAPQQGATDTARPEPDEATKRLVAQWAKKVRAGKDHAEPAFKRIRKNLEMARLGSDQAWADSGKYRVPIVMRHINQSVATLYAKNPQPQAKRRPRLDYQIWDGTLSSLLAAQQKADQDAQQGLPPDPQGLAMLQEILQVKQQNQMLDRVGKTLECLFSYYTDTEAPNFKVQMKQWVRRTKVCGVGYMWLDFQRLMEENPEITARMEDTVSKIERVKVLMQKLSDNEISEGDAMLAELQSNLADLQQDKDIIVREGPVVGFPTATEIIFDPATRQIRGLVGTKWLARERLYTRDKAREIYKVDVGTGFKGYYADGKGGVTEAKTTDKQEDSLACFWEIWDHQNRQTFVLCDGYADWVRPPATPECAVSRFWPLYVLVFNDIEAEEDQKGAIYPLSDVEILTHPQMEYNRSRETLRQHRIANTPKWVAARGMLEDSDKTNLGTPDAHVLIEVNGMQPGTKVEEILQRVPTAPVDPALYDTTGVMQDVERSVGGAQENLGGTSNGTATSSSIAESSRSVAADANVDDLDECLSDLAQGMSEMMLLNLSVETVKKIAGAGAVWPQMTAQDVAEQVYLTVKAGSSGKPNRAAELANMERGIPLLTQIPGVNPTPIAEKYADLLDLGLEDMIVEGIPSIVAMNAMASRPAGPPAGAANDPNAQGPAGGANAPQQPGQAPGGQPARPVATGLPPVGAQPVAGGLPLQAA